MINQYCNKCHNATDWAGGIDLEGVTSMDSSALGMLLLLREHAGGDDADIRILNAGTDLRNTLRVAGLDRLLTLG